MVFHIHRNDNKIKRRGFEKNEEDVDWYNVVVVAGMQYWVGYCRESDYGIYRN